MELTLSAWLVSEACVNPIITGRRQSMKSQAEYPWVQKGTWITCHQLFFVFRSQLFVCACKIKAGWAHCCICGMLYPCLALFSPEGWECNVLHGTCSARKGMGSNEGNAFMVGGSVICDSLLRDNNLNAIIWMHSLWKAQPMLDSLLRDENWVSAPCDSDPMAYEATGQNWSWELEAGLRAESDWSLFPFGLFSIDLQSNFHVASGNV